jgi:hypothetical protein
VTHRIVTSRFARPLAAATLGLAMLATVALVAVAGSPRPAHANGVPTEVNLSYIGLSNWGPEDASGLAELMLAEGIVRVAADGLPRLENESYQGWLVNSESGDAISFGRFNASALGTVAFEGTLPPIADFGFDLIILTAEPDPDDAPQASSQRGIGGYFSLVGERGADGANDAGAAGTAPEQLPNTGDPALFMDIARMSLLAAAMGLSLFVGVRLARRHS